MCVCVFFFEFVHVLNKLLVCILSYKKLLVLGLYRAIDIVMSHVFIYLYI